MDSSKSQFLVNKDLYRLHIPKGDDPLCGRTIKGLNLVEALYVVFSVPGLPRLPHYKTGWYVGPYRIDPCGSCERIDRNRKLKTEFKEKIIR